jgi:putative endonuclease
MVRQVADVRDRQPCVYILASAFLGTLYVGVTSNLIGRLMQHREGRFDGFTTRYGVLRLVWYEMADTMEAAIATEKRIKRWRRDWKIALIEQRNPRWEDLAVGLGLPPLVTSPGLEPGSMEPHATSPEERWTPAQGRGDGGSPLQRGPHRARDLPARLPQHLRRGARRPLHRDRDPHLTRRRADRSFDPPRRGRHEQLRPALAHDIGPRGDTGPPVARPGSPPASTPASTCPQPPPPEPPSTADSRP